MTTAGSNAASLQDWDQTSAEQSPEKLLEFAVNLASQDMQRVDQTIRDRLDSDIALIRTLGAYIVKSGGKRMRPLILLLCARACGYQGEQHTLLAAVIEFIHTATLLHDDVVDASALRRGQPTANDVWGNEASVLVGDFLYTRAFEMMVETDRMEVMQILASTTNAIAEGEVQQLLNAHSPGTSEQAYLETIHRKTAKLFEAAALLGGVICEQEETVNLSLARYGIHLGTAFQLVDDVMDYISDSDSMGKEVGDDLAEGKPTLPLIHAMANGTAAQKQVVSDAIEQGSRDQIDAVLKVVRSTGAIEYTLDAARTQADAAIECLDCLPIGDYRKALSNLAAFSVLRSR